MGVDMCGSVLVRQIKADWPSTRKVFVTYTKTFCDHLGVVGDCRVLMRIQDEAGRPVVGARFDTVVSLGSGSQVSDTLGRLFWSIKRSEKLEGLIVAEVYRPARFSEVCFDDLEPKIILRKP